jgi:hypothetical protein
VLSRVVRGNDFMPLMVWNGECIWLCILCSRETSPTGGRFHGTASLSRRVVPLTADSLKKLCVSADTVQALIVC